MSTTRYTVWVRYLVEVNTDPQRRCYNGCHYSSEMRWTEWTDLLTYSLKATADDTAALFKQINKSREYTVLPEGTKP